MNEAVSFETKEKTSQTLAHITTPQHVSMKVTSVRVSGGSYFSALMVFTVIGTLFFRFQLDSLALLFIATGWVLMPFLAFTDRIVFDGRFIYRKGFIAFFERLLRRRRLKLSIEDVERVETMAVRTLIRGGRVHYRYRTEVTGKDLRFVFASGRGYQEMVRKLFSVVNAEKLDMRSLELRDYFVAANELDANVAMLNISSSDALGDSTSRLKKSKQNNSNQLTSLQEKDKEHGLLLRQTANQLRASGRLKQAAEAFRRALTALPNDSWLLFEFARFLRSHANTLRDVKLLRRSSAALRLAKLKAKEDAKLLSRIGESYFEYGDMESAANNFHRAVELDSASFRAEMGLAEVGIRNGKLAHVIHHYASAARIAPDKALKRFAQGEIDYYSMLNSDEDYLDREIRRIDRLQFILFARRNCVRVTIISFIFALLSSTFDETLANVGWTFTATSLGLWFFLVLTGKLYTERNDIPSIE